MTDQTKPLSASELNRLFEESKNQCSEHLSDLRVHNNLYQGNHFNKKGTRANRAMEESAGGNEEIKIRITKNHVNTICKYIKNSITSMAPTGSIAPKDPGEMQDQKSAQIHKMVFDDYKYRNKFNSQLRRWVDDFVVSGEVFVNVFWDPSKGLKVTPNPSYNPLTQQLEQPAPYPEGDVVIERIFPWDIRLDPGAKDFDEAMWVGYEKMVDPQVIRTLFRDHPELDKLVKEDTDDTYKVFEAASGSYKVIKGKVKLRQVYYRQCDQYPNGQYVFFTKETIAAQGDLPVDKNGNVFFPIIYKGFDEVPTSARSTSIIKQIKPEQFECNRCASSIALIQMTVGFDKMIVPTGGEVSSGGTKAGVRIIKVPGGKQNADIIQGRSGDQFLATLQQSISEMYSKTGVPENWDEKTQDTDIMATLYKSMRQKTRFSTYGDKFSEFIIDVIEMVLRLKKAYMLDETFFRVTGKQEYQNIAEFRSMDDLGYQVKIEAATEDLESKFGRYMSLMQTMQYAGKDLDKNTMGLMLKNLPFMNTEEIYSKMTMPYENAKNIMLALDRGEMPEISQIEDPLYIAEELNHRMRKPDFKYLNEQIKGAYQQQLDAYNQIYTEKTREVQMAQQGFIPFDGPTVPVDGMYEEVIGPSGQPKTQRVQIEQSALNWLLEKKKQQGSVMGNIVNLPLGQQAQLAEQFNQGVGMSPQAPNQMPVPQY
jgi:hypothetical protein